MSRVAILEALLDALAAAIENQLGVPRPDLIRAYLDAWYVASCDLLNTDRAAFIARKERTMLREWSQPTIVLNLGNTVYGSATGVLSMRETIDFYGHNEPIYFMHRDAWEAQEQAPAQTEGV